MNDAMFALHVTVNFASVVSPAKRPGIAGTPRAATTNGRVDQKDICATRGIDMNLRAV